MVLAIDCQTSANGICIMTYALQTEKGAELRPPACQKSHILLRGRPLVQGVPSPKTVHRTVFEFTPCGAFSGYMWGFAPHPTRAVSP